MNSENSHSEERHEGTTKDSRKNLNTQSNKANGETHTVSNSGKDKNDTSEPTSKENNTTPSETPLPFNSAASKGSSAQELSRNETQTKASGRDQRDGQRRKGSWLSETSAETSRKKGFDGNQSKANKVKNADSGRPRSAPDHRRPQRQNGRAAEAQKNSHPSSFQHEGSSRSMDQKAEASISKETSETQTQKTKAGKYNLNKFSKRADASDRTGKETDGAITGAKPNRSVSRKAPATTTSKPKPEDPLSPRQAMSKETSSHQKTPTRQITDSRKNRTVEKDPTECSASSETEKAKKNTENVRSPRKPEAKETTLYVKFQETFDDIKACLNFLKEKLNIENLEFQVTDVTHLNGFMYCTVICPSRNRAMKIVQLLDKDRSKVTSRVRCSYCKFPEQRRIQGEKEKREFAIAETMFEVDKNSDNLLEIHARKVLTIQRRIDEKKKALKRLDTHDQAKIEIEILEQKQHEFEKQKREFMTARDLLKTLLCSVKDKDDFETELRTLKKRFDREKYRFDKSLPIYARRKDILELVKENQVSVILGETGSGKSTQLVQYLQEAGLGESGIIVCTQPRRVAAISLATHVADEMITKIGQEVGYRVGSRCKQSPVTKILFTTDHSLLNECLKDPELRQFSCIIVDEAHERSLYTDLLLSMIKKCLPQRPDLRVIITSATIDPKVFQHFFGGCPMLSVTGRTFPVDVVYLGENEETLQDYEEVMNRAIQKVMEIHTEETKEPLGDILVFVTSPAETEKCCQLLSKKMDMRADFKCLQLHGKQQPEEQQKVFIPPGRGKRKIVFATNCAETSITIDGIKYVVDTGLAKEMRYDPKRNLNSLSVSIISKSSADQRKGRAGRTAPGKCYRLYSEEKYETMESVTLPEILRIHLGHALLKLAELGVGRETYEFVQSPSEDTIQDAMEMLSLLGALFDGEITDKGRWIAKLPFDPQLGLLTYMGREQNILYDSVVLAAIMSAEGGVFYRGTSEEDQRSHDMMKTIFSVDKGDCLTCLAVYKAWLTVPEAQKNAWCMENSLNAKALRGVRETVKDVCRILDMDLKTVSFSQEDKTENLQRMVFSCYSVNLCHYLGRENAGYYAVRASRRVNLHPSSCLRALAFIPEWVVFSQLIQTSQDFITGITPVEESWVMDMGEKVLGFDPNEIRQKTIKKTFSSHVGSKAFYDVVGPRYTRLRELEGMFSTSAASVIFIEATREMGEISVYCTEKTEETAKLIDELEKTIKEAVVELEKDDREVGVAGSPKQGVRAVLGQGGQVQEILMPNQSRKLFVRKPSPDATEEMIREKFSKFGEIKFCHKFEEGGNWGFLIFKTAEQAVDAERGTRFNYVNVGQVEHRRPAKDETNFGVRLYWCRMPCQGFAFVRIARKFFVRCLRLETIYVDAQLVTISPAKGRIKNRLHLEGITETMTEDLIQRSLLHALGREENAENIIFEVFIPRHRPAQLSTLNKMKRQIEDFFSPHVAAPDDGSHCNVYLSNPEPDDIEFRARINFRDPVQGNAAYEKLKYTDFKISILDRKERVEMIPWAEIKTGIQRPMWNLCQADLGEAVTVLADRNVVVKINTIEEEPGRLLTVRADSIEEAVQARTYLDVVMRGEVINCPGALVLFTPGGAALLGDIERETGANITIDKRSRKVTIRGPEQSRIRVRQIIAELTQQTHDSQEHCLRGDSKPPGLMKALIMKYGEDLNGLLRATGLQSAAVNFRWHRLTVVGCSESLERAAVQISELIEAVWAESSKERPSGDQEMEECSACICPIEVGQLYRLELCAHPYCKDCFKHQVHYAIKDQAIPIACCHEGCDRHFAFRDFNNLSRQGHLDMSALTKAAVAAYVKTNTAFRHCPTADCPAVYKVTKKYDTSSWRYGQPRVPAKPSSTDHQDVFVCPACCISTCTMCHHSAHIGMPCSEVAEEGEAADPSLDEWAEEDAENRKRCPGCNSMIEKNHGCNKLTCGLCKTVFCWVCLQSFKTDGFCYDHLTQKHGGIFPANYRERQDPVAHQRHGYRMHRGLY